MKRNLTGLFILGGCVAYLGVKRLVGHAAFKKCMNFEVILTNKRHHTYNEIMKLDFNKITDVEKERLNGYIKSINDLDDQLEEVVFAENPYSLISKINYVKFYKENRYDILNNEMNEFEAYIKELLVKYNID